MPCACPIAPRLFPANEGSPQPHSSIFRPQCSLPLLWAPHASLPPTGCFPQGSAHHLKLAPALLAHPRPPPQKELCQHTLWVRLIPSGSEGEGDKPASSIACILQATCEQGIPGVISYSVKRSPEVTFWLVKGWTRMRSALALASGDLAHLMTQPWKAMGMLGFGAAAVSWHQTGDAGDIGALHPFGIRREDTRQSDLHHQDRCSSTTGHSCFYGPHQLCQSRALYKHHPQLPPPGMRPWGSWLVTSKVLSHMCSPQTLQQHAWGPHNSTQCHDPPTPHHHG